MTSLFVIRGNDQGTRFELDDGEVHLGRVSSNGIPLHDNEVSRQHALLQCSDGRFTIVDLDSSNGTFVNGQRVKEHLLASGDHVQLGGTLMLFTGSAEDSDADLTDKVKIASFAQPDDASHIIRSVSHEEGLFQVDADPLAAEGGRAQRHLEVMYRTALAVSQTLDIDQLLNRIMELIFEWVEADRGCIMLINPETKVLEPRVRHAHRGGRRAEEKITLSQTILDYVMERNEGVLTSDAGHDERWAAGASIVRMGIREAICVPMRGRYDVVGVIHIDTSTSPEEVIRLGRADKFNEDHLKLMVAIAHQAALAVEDTRYYSAMVQAERLAAIGQTIAMLSHHIKNILQGIRGGSYLIEMGLTEHDESIVGKGWKIVEKNQGKISNLVMDMLTYSKERKPEIIAADVNEVVRDCVELVQARAADLEVDLSWQPCEEIPRLVFDPEAIHRAVLNVITNAVDAASENDTTGRVSVVVEYHADDDLAAVIIRDNGPGIDASRIDTLFNPFVSSKGNRGTGLGLPVSKKILTEHGGRIDVESTPGSGSRFALVWPAVRAESDTSS